MWWWIFWHFMTDYEHIVVSTNEHEYPPACCSSVSFPSYIVIILFCLIQGHFEFPEARSWTDAELGIPPDDAEDPEMAEPIPPPSVFAFRQTKPDYPC